MKRYAKYKKVDLPWLKEVPEHWEIKPNKAFLKLSKELVGNKEKEYELLSLSKQGIRIKGNDDFSGKMPDSFENYQIVKQGQLIMCLFDLDQSAVFSGISNYEGKITSAYDIFDIVYMSKDFVDYYFKYIFQGRKYKLYSKSVRYTITKEDFKNIKSIIPPIQEQIQIANFLDWKISEIDKLIELETSKIEKLDEYKKNKIFSLATYGINNDLIKTNIQWIEYLPKNWQLKKAKHLFNKEKREISDSDEIITCFRDGTVTLRKNRRLEGFTEAINEYGYQGIRKGDLVIHVMDAFAGAIGVSDSDGKSTPVYNVCTSKMNLNNHYYKYLIRYMAYTGYIKSFYRGIRERSTNFTFDIFKEIILPLPSKEEQDKIVMECEQIEYKIDNLISKTNKQIIYLQELKQTLISDVVTGKMDVRYIEIPEKYRKEGD